MVTIKESLMNIIEELDPEYQDELLDFAEYLLQKQGPPPSEKPTFKWAGALRHLKDKYTSVELQHEILREWSEDS